jgi:hypothetical protein
MLVIRRVALLLGLALVGSALITPSAGAAPNYDRTCGLLPGDGAFGFVRAKDTTCRRAWKVTRKATRKFCRQNNDCLIDWETNIEQIYRGTLKWNGWRCKVTYGWELIRTKCRKGKRIVIWRAAA